MAYTPWLLLDSKTLADGKCPKRTRKPHRSGTVPSPRSREAGSQGEAANQVSVSYREACMSTPDNNNKKRGPSSSKRLVKTQWSLTSDGLATAMAGHRNRSDGMIFFTLVPGNFRWFYDDGYSTYLIGADYWVVRGMTLSFATSRAGVDGSCRVATELSPLREPVVACVSTVRPVRLF